MSVGTSGSCEARFGPETPSARILPLWMCPSIDGSALNMNCTLPARRSVVPGALPCKGTCTASMPVMKLNIDPASPWVVAAPSERVVQRAGFRLCERDEFLRGLRRNARVHDQHQRREADHRDRREILQRVVRVVLHERRRHYEYRRGEPERVTVLGRRGDGAHADGVAATALVLDDHGLLHALRQLLPDEAGKDVGAAARSVGDDDPDRLGGIVLRQCAGG